MLKVVNLCITNTDKNKILFIKRNKVPFRNYWGMLGGKIENDEEHSDAASRELREESGILSEGEFLGKCHEKNLENGEVINEFDIYFYHFVIGEDSDFISDTIEGEIKWFNLDELKGIEVIPSDPLMINAFLNKNKKEALSIIQKIEEKYFQDKFIEDNNK